MLHFSIYLFIFMQVVLALGFYLAVHRGDLVLPLMFKGVLLQGIKTQPPSYKACSQPFERPPHYSSIINLKHFLFFMGDPHPVVLRSTPGSVLMTYSWHLRECWGLNLGRLRSRQILVPLFFCSSTQTAKIFLGRKMGIELIS